MSKPESNAASTSQRIASQIWFELMAILRHGEQLIISLVIPIIILLALIHTPFINQAVGVAGTMKVDIATPGVLALCIMSSAFTGQSIATGFDRRYGVLKYLATTPIGRSGLLTGKICAVFLVILLQLTIISTIALFYGWKPHLDTVPYTLFSILLGVTAFTSLGLLMGGTLRAEATLALANLLFVLLIGLGGLVYPSSLLPSGLQWISERLPSGALGNALRGTLDLHHIPLFSWIILSIWTVIAATACIKYFKWQ